MVDSHRSIVSLGSVQGLQQNGHANVVFDDVAVTADKAGTSSGVGLFAVVEPPSPEAGSAVPIESIGLVAAASIQEIGASRHSAIGTNSGSNSTEMAGVATPSGGSVGSKNSGFVVGTSAQQQRGPAFRSNRSIVADIFQQSVCSSRGILVQHRQHKVVDEVGNACQQMRHRVVREIMDGLCVLKLMNVLVIVWVNKRFLVARLSVQVVWRILHQSQFFWGEFYSGLMFSFWYIRMFERV